MKLNPLIVAPAAVLVAHANGATIASANFNSLTVSGATSVAASGTPGVNEFTWTRIGTTTFSTPNVNMQSGTQNALAGDTVGTFQGMIGTMTNSTTIPIGGTFTLSFIGQYTQSPGDTANALRFGFVNTADPDNAFGVSVSTGTSTGFVINRDTGGDNSPLAGTMTPLATSTTPSNHITTNVYTALFSITRTDTDIYSYFGDINGQTITAANVAGGFDNYSAIVIRNGSLIADFQIDNVSVSLIPEPSTALLGSLGLLALLRRRR